MNITVYIPTIKIEELKNEEAPNHHHSQSDDEEPPIQEALLEESPIVPNPMRQGKKQQEYVACPQCKNQRYSKHLSITTLKNADLKRHNLQ